MNNNDEDTKEYKNVWEYRIKEAFKRKENIGSKSNSSKMLWQIVNLILYENSKDRVLGDLYHGMDKENFVKMISIIDGRNFHPPSKQELEETLLLALLYYEKEIEEKSWKQIQKEVGFPFSSIKYGIRIKNLSNWIEQKIQELVRDYEKEEENE